jgi:hypothetical protein
MEVSGQLHAPGVFTPGESLRYPFDRILGGPQSLSGHGDGKKETPAPAGNLTPIVHPVAKSL